jgi:O-antigen/teichoic acid export membrane protein
MNLLRLAAEPRLLALVDQAIVSGASFVATVLVARFGGASELASYSIASSVLLLLIGAQNTIVILPYVVHRRYHAHAPRVHAGSTLILNAGLAVAAALLLAIAAGAYLLWNGGQTAWIVLALAFAGPCILAREFARRYAFAHLQVNRAMQVDTATTVVQLCALAVLGRLGLMSAETAILAFGVSCLLSACGWFWLSRRDFDLRGTDLRPNVEKSWRLGRWLLANQVISNLQGYGCVWLSAAILGTAATGVLAACISVVAVANPLIFGLDNVLTPRLSAAFAKGNRRDLLAEALRNLALIGGLMAAVCIAILVGGDALMHLFYPAAEFGGYHAVLVVLAFGTAALALTLPASSAIAVLERPREILVTGIVSLAITIVSSLLLMQQAGIMGVALGTLLGNASCLAGRWALLLTEVMRPAADAPAADVSAEYTNA